MRFKTIILALTVMPVIAYLAFKLESEIGVVYDKISDQAVLINTTAQENLAGVRLVKAFGREKYEIQKFLEQNPKHELAANAHYWIGETHYSEKNYEPAILAFQEVIKNFPDKDKVPAAMLKQAMAFNAINDAKSAKYILKKLVDGYPKSDEAKKGKELLKELK